MSYNNWRRFDKLIYKANMLCVHARVNDVADSGDSWESWNSWNSWNSRLGAPFPCWESVFGPQAGAEEVCWERVGSVLGAMLGACWERVGSVLGAPLKGYLGAPRLEENISSEFDAHAQLQVRMPKKRLRGQIYPIGWQPVG